MTLLNISIDVIFPNIFFKTHSFTQFLYYFKTVIQLHDIFELSGCCHKNKKSTDWLIFAELDNHNF